MLPRFGRITALLIEAIIMLTMIVSSRWVMRRFDVPQTLGSTIPMCLVALAILVPAEIGRCPVGARFIPTGISCELRDGSRRHFGDHVPAVCRNAVSPHAINTRPRLSDLLSLTGPRPRPLVQHLGFGWRSGKENRDARLGTPERLRIGFERVAPAMSNGRNPLP